MDKQRLIEETAMGPVPGNLDAEKSLLGCLLLSEFAIDDVQEFVNAEDFQRHAHQVIYRAICEVHRDENPTNDTVLVCQKLEEMDQLAEVGGPLYIVELMETVPHAAHATQYAKIVRKYARHRAFRYLAFEMLHQSEGEPADFDAMLATTEGKLHNILESTIQTDAVPFGDVMSALMDHMESGGKARLKTGWTDLDKLILGLEDSTLTIVAARPSMGKTALVSNLLTRLAISGTPVLMFSLEQARLELAERILSSSSGIDGNTIKSNQMSEFDRDRMMHTSGELHNLPLFIDDVCTRTIAQIGAVTRRMVRKHGVRLVAIDYLQLVIPEDRRQPREAQVASISRGLKQLARSLEIPVVCLAQLNRASEARQDKMPLLSDLRESGSIEQDADMVWLIHRPFVANPQNGDPNEAWLKVGKNRNGSTGVVPLHWRGSVMTFDNSSNQQEYHEPKNDEEGYHGEW